MHRHLVAVEVRIKGGADQRMQLDRLSFNERRLKRLNAQPVQGGCAVEQHRIFFYHFIKSIPYLRGFSFHNFFSTFYRGNHPLLFQTVINKGFEQLQRHLLWQAALMEP